MRVGAEALVEGLYAAWRIQDIEATLIYCADDIRYSVQQRDGMSGVGGLMLGKPTVRSYLEAFCATWEILYLEPRVLRIEDNVVRGQLKFRALHRRTNLALDGIKRHVWVVGPKLLASCEEYHDADQIKAFLTMAEGHVDAGEPIY